MPSNKVCYLDLDGVLVDFVSGALAAHGKDIRRADVRWDLAPQFGMGGADEPKFWAPFGYGFWAGLGWMPEGRAALLEVELAFGSNVVLLTSPCDTPRSVEGKVAWIKRELPEYSRRFFVGPAKHLMAGATKVLVDDHDGNTDKFAAHGGRTVLVPRPWNRRRGETDSAGCFDIGKFRDELAAA